MKKVEIVPHDYDVAYYHRLHHPKRTKKFIPPIIIDDDVIRISLKMKHPEWISLIILHEDTEMKFRNKGLSYKKAHKKATEAEMKFAKKHKIDWKGYMKMVYYIYGKEKIHRRSLKIFSDKK